MNGKFVVVFFQKVTTKNQNVMCFVSFAVLRSRHFSLLLMFTTIIVVVIPRGLPSINLTPHWT